MKKRGIRITSILFFLLILTISVYTLDYKISGTNYEYNVNNSYGMAVFANSTSGSRPTYNVWNNTKENFTEDLATVSLGTGNDAEWVRIESCHEREEYIMVALTDSLDKYVQIYNGTDWSNNISLTTSSSLSDKRDFDVAYEDHSGDALIVYDNITSDDTVSYITWNGTDYTSEQTLNTGLANGISRFIILKPKKNSDDIMLVALNNNLDIFASLWNGTDFNTSSAITLTATTATDFNFDFAWEESSGEGLLVYGLNGDEAYYTNYYTNGSFGPETYLQDTSGAQEPEKIKLCSDPTSDYIGIMVLDIGDDLNVTIWNGTNQITEGQPVEETSIEPVLNPERVQFDCAWNSTGGALFTFIDDTISRHNSTAYVTYDKTGWSVSDLANAPIVEDIGVGYGVSPIESLKLVKHPVTDDVFAMTITNDANNALRMIRYLANSTWDSNVYELALDSFCANNANCLDFDWYEYDPVPNVTDITTNQTLTNFSLNDEVLINVTVTDNINVSAVQANISIPQNSSSFLLDLNDDDLDSFYNGTFSTTDQKGTYTITIIANDTSTHNNINDTESITFNVGDIVYPNVTWIEPPNATALYQLGEAVNIQVNVTDDLGIDSVLANVTLPDGSISPLVFYNLTPNEDLLALPVLFEQNETSTAILGTYTINIIVNDTSDNTNLTETRTFLVGDETNPLVFNLKPVADTNYDNFSQVEISANATDNFVIDYIYANITLPNGTEYILQLINGSEDDFQTYNATFNLTDLKDYYNITFVANDTANNVNQTTTNFSIGDYTIPSEITLDSPSDEFNTTSTSLTFNFTALDDRAEPMNCSLMLNNGLNTTNLSTSNDTLTILEVTNPADGKYEWNVTCTDQFDNSNTSNSRILRVDTTHPSFNSLDYTPSAADHLDPGVTIDTSSNVTDDVVGINTAILQYKVDSGDWTNITAAYDSDTSKYNASFIATNAGTYYLRLYADDLLGNYNQSAEINFSVALERTWVRTPADLGAITAALGENKSIGTLTINNTGDYSLEFTITSDYSETYFDNPTIFTLNSGSIYNLGVNASRSTEGATLITINISSSANADPVSRTTTAILANVSGQPILTSTFTTPSEDTLTVTQGDTQVEFTSLLENKGDGNATNMTFFIDAPDEWTITLGNKNLTYEDYGDLELVEPETDITNTIKVTIPSNATTGSFTITTNATGYNESGTDIAEEGLIFGDTVTVTVNAVPTILGAEVPITTTSSTTAAAAPATAGGTVSRTPGVETIYTSKTFEIRRGEEKGLPLTITNSYENAYMENIRLEVIGFLPQYIKIKPPKTLPQMLNYLESLDYTVEIFAPPYLEKKEYRLSLKITADVVAINPALAGFSRKKVEEYRTVKFLVREVSPEETLDLLEEARLSIQAMDEAGIPTKTAKSLLEQAEKQQEAEEYETARDLVDQILEIRKSAFEAQGLIKDVQNKLEEAKSRWLKTSETEDKLALAVKAFEREDFKTAIERAKDAQLVYILETRGKVNILWFLSKYWWEIIIGLIIAGIITLLIYRKLIVYIIAQRLKNLVKEEAMIISLMKEAQKECFEEKKISTATYHKLMYQYETRLTKIRQIRAKLRSKKAGIIKTEQELENLEKEHEEIINLIKKAQIAYFQEKTISKKAYLDEMALDQERLAEVEEGRAVLEEKLAKEKISKKYKIMKKISDTLTSLQKVVQRIKEKKEDRKKKKRSKGKWLVLKIKEKPENPEVKKEEKA